VDEEHALELGTDIISSDGEKLGTVDSLVVDPHTGKVQSIIVRKGFLFPVDKILPIDMVARVGDEGVTVNVTKHDVDQLAEYMDANYMWPPAGYYGHMGYMWPAAAVYAQDMSDLLVDEQVHERSPDAIIISEGTTVVDKDGDDLGRITELARDDRGRVAGFKVEQGLFRHHEHYIPAHVISAADDHLVRLSVDTATLEGMTGRHPR
jgi:uncharacterized protein YrrD